LRDVNSDLVLAVIRCQEHYPGHRHQKHAKVSLLKKNRIMNLLQSFAFALYRSVTLFGNSINASTKLWRDDDRPGQVIISRHMTITSGFDVEVNIL
jgi:hypothetical protein